MFFDQRVFLEPVQFLGSVSYRTAKVEKSELTCATEASILCLVRPCVAGLTAITTSAARITPVLTWHGLRMADVMCVVTTRSGSLDDILSFVIGSDFDAGC